MATLGSYTLLAAFVACAYAAAAAVAGHRRHSARLVESGIGAFYLVTALMTFASAIIVRAFVIGDYSIRYVDRYSDSIQPLFYRLTSYWGGLDGSIMSGSRGSALRCAASWSARWGRSSCAARWCGGG